LGIEAYSFGVAPGLLATVPGTSLPHRILAWLQRGKSMSDKTPNPLADEELEAQLVESRKLREQANVKVKRAEETAVDMSRILRRIAEAMDRNPQSWDALFLDKQRHP
jgi:hypothetical protein